MITTVTKENFDQEVLMAKEPVLVDFWAAWCMPCKMLSPIVDQVASERSDVKVCKINIDDEGELAIRYGVMSIPTLIVFKNGEIANKSIGLISKEDILALL
ncbi:MAG: thioredoxin [Candidatus Fimisoma sp.]|jgi:thioredoxin 1|nr:thioredoxin [Bacillota bacterium]MDD7284962.1 thioredoxin [Bacillota bacterium]